MKNIFFFLLVSSLSSKSQTILLDKKWNNKINEALELVRVNEPLINQTVQKSYIQSGMLREIGMDAFAEIDDRSNSKIYWIMIDKDAMNEFDTKMIASIIVHESLHLMLYYHGSKGLIWHEISEVEQKAEHDYIYNYQIDFLKRIKASGNAIAHFKRIMNK